MRGCLEGLFWFHRFLKENYQIEKKDPVWIPAREKRQHAILEAIPEEHQLIFYWLKYHYKRPGEAMALHK